MLVRKLNDCEEILAGDNSQLREILHPDRNYPFAGRYSLACARVKPGEATRKHKLMSDEVYYILKGTGAMHVGDNTAEVEPGDAIDIPPGAIQWIENTGDDMLEFLCIVDPAWRIEDEEVLE